MITGTHVKVTTNIIVGAIFAILWFVGAIDAALSSYFEEALMTLASVVASLLIVWLRSGRVMVT